MNHLLRPRNWERACRSCRLRCGIERSAASANNMAVLPDVLGCRLLRRTIQVRLAANPAVPRDELSGGTTIFAVSRQQFMNYPG